MTYEFKSPAGFALFVGVVCGVVVLWQKADSGLEYVRSQLRHDAKLASKVGSVQSVFAYKARYMDDQRQYWIVVTGSNDSVTMQVVLHYDAGSPQRMVVER